MAIMICSESDVYDRAGGQGALAQLIDPQGTGTWSTNVLTKARQDASEQVLAYGNVQVDAYAWYVEVQAGRQSWPHILVDLSSQLAIVRCWQYGTSGRALPDDLRERETRVMETCGAIRDRKISLGAPARYPGTNQLFTRVDNDPCRNRLTLRNFKRGFI